MKTFTSAHLPPRVSDFLATNPVGDVRGSGAQHTALMPFTGEELFSFPTATPKDVAAAVTTARAGVGQGNRGRILLKLHDLIRKHEELILDLIQAENGKSRSHAYDEVMDLYNCARFYGVNIRKAFGPERHPGALPVLTKTRTQHYPLGVVGLISPWNYPLSLGVGDVLAALSAGNSVVHKPDSQTTLTAILVRRLAIEAGLPEAAWQLVPGNGAEVGDALIPLVDGLSFTGSTKVGKSIATQAAGRLIPTMLELGGKNPMLVLDDAPLEPTARGAVRTAFSSSGQLCMSAERAYVHTDIYKDFLVALKKALDKQTLGAAFSDAATIGSLTSQKQLDSVQAHVRDAVDKGATIVYGGKHRPELGPFFFEPTVLTGVTQEMELFANETFGPVLAVYEVDSDAAAIHAANDTNYGLCASVWSGSPRHGWEVASQLEAGMVNINEGFAAAYGSIAAPGGGVKESGLNHRHGITGMRLWANKRTVAEQKLHPLAPSELLPPQRFQKLITTGMAAMKALRL
ncbi:succinic semialdehyde dehydrogenase [Corynebacterium sp. HMSC071F07]|uniref:succinic semialdehyde dehydrogenase n=1 Tax=Corynebacterium sp. HMSC071F07 TaxID=1715203 RepID=UPI0008A3A9C0|nr:succinic semialdehyde dehydrogenase [Corynebacterium sp. HMSC071F07]OFL97801.1 succinic semialdehyde dehydrogenase [Corynebacterium sp. HMSC071F07]